MTSIDEIMSQAQEFASGWSIVGGRFDGGDALEIATESKAMLRNMIAAALADARREGAEQMREACTAAVARYPLPWVVHEIDALPMPTGPRQAVRLTDAEVKQVGDATLYAGGIYDRVRAIEAAVLAANGIGGGNG